MTIVGGREREIHVVVNADVLAGYGLGIADVKKALTSQNIEVPGGRVDQGNVELTLRTLGRVQNPLDFENLVIKTIDGTAIKIGDVARIEDTTEEPRDLARLDGRPASA